MIASLCTRASLLLWACIVMYHIEATAASRLRFGSFLTKHLWSNPARRLNSFFHYSMREMSKLFQNSYSGQNWQYPYYATADERCRDVAIDTKNRNMFPSLPPLVWFLMATSSVDASPLNPQTVVLKSPFFQGWLVRVVDHEQSTSFIFIVGSFSQAGSDQYLEHYVFCGLSNPKIGKKCMEHFPSVESVTISGAAPSAPSLMRNNLDGRMNINITWAAENRGFFKFTEDTCEGYYHFSDHHYNVQFSSKRRIPWSYQKSSSPNDQMPGIGGPEGWLAFTSLLPCHYFVHSVGSQCKYAFYRSRWYVSRNIRPSLERSLPISSLDSTNSDESDFCGTGFAHIEGNHGVCFPDGWTWSQGVAVENKASFSLTAGKFEIGSLKPTSCIFFLRRRNGKRFMVRSTDGDTVHYEIDALEKRVSLNATSILKGYNVEIIIEAKNSSASYDAAHLHVPTVHGFSNNPGCDEYYNAVAKVRLKIKGRKWNKGRQFATQMQSQITSKFNEVQAFLISNLTATTPFTESNSNLFRSIINNWQSFQSFLTRNVSISTSDKDQQSKASNDSINRWNDINSSEEILSESELKSNNESQWYEEYESSQYQHREEEMMNRTDDAYRDEINYDIDHFTEKTLSEDDFIIEINNSTINPLNETYHMKDNIAATEDHEYKEYEENDFLIEEYEFPLTALEFGGSFINKKIYHKLQMKKFHFMK